MKNHLSNAFALTGLLLLAACTAKDEPQPQPGPVAKAETCQLVALLNASDTTKTAYAFEYYVDGKIKRKETPSTVIEYTYNGQKIVEKRTAKDPAQAESVNRVITYELNNKGLVGRSYYQATRTTKWQNGATSPSTTTDTTTYWYDGSNFLVLEVSKQKVDDYSMSSTGELSPAGYTTENTTEHKFTDGNLTESTTTHTNTRTNSPTISRRTYQYFDAADYADKETAFPLEREPFWGKASKNLRKQFQSEFGGNRLFIVNYSYTFDAKGKIREFTTINGEDNTTSNQYILKRNCQIAQ